MAHHKAQTTASAAAINPFKAGNYSSASFETKAARGITFTSSEGIFTVAKEGLYTIVYRPTLQAGADAFVTIIISVNGVAMVTANTPQIDSSVDPRDVTVSAFLALELGDEITVTADSNASVNVTHQAGTSITILRYFGLFRHLDILETAAASLISDDNTINTYSRGNLSAQHDRNVDQVPFKFGIRGPGTLRGRGTNPSVVKGGDKKA